MNFCFITLFLATKQTFLLLFLDYGLSYLYHFQMLYRFLSVQGLFRSVKILLSLSIYPLSLLLLSFLSSFDLSALLSSDSLCGSVNAMMWCLSRSTCPPSRKTPQCSQIKNDPGHFQRYHYCLFPCSSASAIADSALVASLGFFECWIRQCDVFRLLSQLEVTQILNLVHERWRMSVIALPLSTRSFRTVRTRT